MRRERKPAAMIVAIVAVSTASCGGSSGSPNETTPERSPATASSEPQVRPLDDVLTTELELEGADWLAAVGGQVWTRLERAQDVVGIDPASNEAGKAIDVGPGFCEGLGAGLGAVWACSGGKLARLDPRAGRIDARFDVEMDPDEGLIGVGEGGVWVLNDATGSETLLRLDPRSGEVLSEIALGHAGTEVAVGEGAVWVSSSDDGLLLRVDPASEEVVEIADLPQARFVAAGGGSVWVSYGDGLARVDPISGEIVASVEEPIGFSGGLAIGDGSLWIRSSVSFLTRLDLSTNEIVETFDPGEEIGGGSVLLAYGSVWATALDENRLWRLDP